MTDLLFRSDPYQREAETTVLGHTAEGGILCDASLFYATGGGQPGDSGTVTWEGNSLPIATAVKVRDTGDIALVPGEPGRLPPVGATVVQQLDWDRRHRHMRVHTALHLLSVVIPLPVTGGAISAEKGRLDFDMPEMTQDRDALQALLTDLVDRDLRVTEDWISEADLARQPDLVKTMSVAPPKGAGTVRLIRIGEGDEQVDLQPCGGTHVARTGEIGALRLGKFEKKGRQNRRVYLHLDS
ncbi:alanyl-tRNA editing protein [Pseudaestuariivita atlantica]|uniref:Ala-tRNA(Pro) hydrolase n=1 Tax=Pseudaestuariivita atlantica TaxID=1317121 RepID=A0A0L1JUN9_9RHOB|nr:alanyl-tRNA editing protein [Pseudaestuariivita atlantica]KNG95460.1 Ala-tRNA(Pro) hydrolase [Pseudaestuariivita atlantica]